MSSPVAANAYDLSVVEAELDSGGSTDAIEAFRRIEATLRRQRVTLEDIAAGRREHALTGDHDFNYVESFWFLVKLAEDVVGDA